MPRLSFGLPTLRGNSLKETPSDTLVLGLFGVVLAETVRVTIMDSTVRIHHGPHEVALHPVCAGRRRRVIAPCHFEGLSGFRPSRAGDPALSLMAPPAPALLWPLGRELLMRAIPDRLSDMLARLKLTGIRDQLDGLLDEAGRQALSLP